MGYLDSLNITGSALTSRAVPHGYHHAEPGKPEHHQDGRGRSLQEEAGCVQGKYTEL